MLAASARAQTNVFTVDSNGNVQATASVGAKAAVGGGTYSSGLTSSGGSATTQYATYLEANLPSNIDLGLDMYSFDLGSRTLYQNTISMFQGVSPPGTAHDVFVEEFGPQAWTVSGGPTGEACAIVGMQSCTWNSFNQNFVASLLPYLSALGVTDASLYGANILGACAPVYPDNPNDDDSVLSVATIAMENHQYSLAATHLSQILSTWNAASLAGGTLAGGRLEPGAP